MKDIMLADTPVDAGEIFIHVKYNNTPLLKMEP